MDDVLKRLSGALSTRYRVDRELGQGGMATVYLAHDLKHEREVAIKVLHPDLGAALGGERFLAEIKTTAKLQHPHILPLLDSGEADGLLYYVMPFVRGETLRARLERERQLPIPDAVRIAREVASALEHAHKQGIIHRDIKPENILLQDGAALVADFGIALAVQSAGGARMTQTGLSLGTPQYMSPEQAMGEKTLDARTDVYALGAITYEMLTGDAPFTGSTVQAIVAKVLTERPTAPRAVRDTVPPGVERAVLRALAKLPADRYTSAGAFVEALRSNTVDDIEVDPAAASGGRAAARASSRSAAAVRMLVPLLALSTLAVSIGWWRSARSAQEPTANGEVRLTVELPPRVQLIDSPRPFALSLDGRQVVVAAEDSSRVSRLWVRSISDVTVTPLGGTEGAKAPTFSSDGKWIAFVANGKLKKVPATGGPVQELADINDEESGIAWGSAGLIFVANGGRIAVVPENGGELRGGNYEGIPEGVSERYPIALPDGRSYLFTTWHGSPQTARVYWRSIDGGAAQFIGADSGVALGVMGKWLAVGSSGTVRLQLLSADYRKVAGPQRQVMDGLSSVFGVTQGQLGQSGAFLYLPGVGARDLIVRGTRGDTSIYASDQREWFDMRLSPDGQRAVGTASGRAGNAIFVIDPRSQAVTRLNPLGMSASRADWMADGRTIVYLRRTSAETALWSQPADGGEAKPFFSVPGKDIWEVAFSPNGEWMLYRTGTLGTADIFFRRLRGADTTSRPFAVQPGVSEMEARFSPDSRWVAYSVIDQGVSQVYVRPFPDGTARYQISTDGGMQPVWGPDGKSLFYVPNRSGAIVRARLGFGNGVQVQSREQVVNGGYYMPIRNGHAVFDVMPDGEHLLLVRRVDAFARPVAAVGWLGEAVQRYQKAGAAP